jgi:tetratricopeptide (TPR) repeat protein
MSAKITRRQALAVGLGTLVAGRLAAAPVPKIGPNASWIGKTVLPKKYSIFADFADPQAGRVPFGGLRAGAYLIDASYTVKGEKDSQLEVLISDGNAVRVERDAMIPVADAVEFFSKALKENDKDTFALNSRGWAYYLLGKPEKAIEDFDKFLKLTPAGVATRSGVPDRWEGLVNRGLVLAEQGEFEKAIKDLNEVIEGRQSSIAYVNRGYCYELMGDYRKALADYDAVLESTPPHTLAANNKAWTLSTCPDEKVRDGAAAVKLAKSVCDATKNREGMYLDTLAAAYAEAGKFDDAMKTEEMALEDKSYSVKYGEDGEKRWQLYKEKKPFRTEPVKK